MQARVRANAERSAMGEQHRGERPHMEVWAGPQRGRMPERRGQSHAVRGRVHE